MPSGKQFTGMRLWWKRCLLQAKPIIFRKINFLYLFWSFSYFRAGRSKAFLIKKKSKAPTQKTSISEAQRCSLVLYFCAFICDSILWVQLIDSGYFRPVIRNTKPRCGFWLPIYLILLKAGKMSNIYKSCIKYSYCPNLPIPCGIEM